MNSSILIRRRPLAAVLVTAALCLPALPAVGDASVQIVAPADGTVVSRSSQPSLAVAGTIDAADVPTPAEATMYLDREEGGCDSKGWVLQPEPTQPIACPKFPGTGIMPLMYEYYYGSNGIRQTFRSAGQHGPVVLREGPIDVRVVLGAYDEKPLPALSGGQLTVTVQLDAFLQGRTGSVRLGEATVSAIVAPSGGDQAMDLQLDIPATLDSALVDRMTLYVRTHGNGYGGEYRFGGQSFITLPTWSSAVQVSLDSAQFDRASTVPATFDSDGSWSADLPLNVTGPRTIYARLIDAMGSVVGTDSRTITVTQ